jgi:hypothetical protein
MAGDSLDPMTPRARLCAATALASPAVPCTEWVQEFDQQARTVAGGGAVAGRISGGGPVAAQAVSDRAGESFAGRHRCCRLDDHGSRFATAHLCQCGHQWTDTAAAAAAPSPPDQESPA